MPIRIEKGQVGRWTPEGYLVSQYFWTQTHQIHTIQTHLLGPKPWPQKNSNTKASERNAKQQTFNMEANLIDLDTFQASDNLNNY